MNRWVWIRVVVYAAAFLAALLSPSPVPRTEPPLQWLMLAVTFVLVPFSLLFTLWILSKTMRLDNAWHYPTWNANPFKLNQPLLVFHFLAGVMVAGGIGDIIQIAHTNAPIYPEALSSLTIGIGMFFGVPLCARVLHARMVRGT